MERRQHVRVRRTDLAEADEGEVAMTSADLAAHIGDAILELTARTRVEQPRS